MRRQMSFNMIELKRIMRNISRILSFSACLILVCTFYNISLADEVTIKTQKMEFVTPDTLHMFGWLTATASKGPAPLIVLLPMFGNDHTSYDSLLKALNQFYADNAHLPPFPRVLALDLRGHGASIKKGHQTIGHDDRNEAEFKKIPKDVSFAIRKVMADTLIKIDTSKIFMVGASVGANAAVMVTKELPFIAKVVMLSPGEKFLGLEPAQAVADYPGKAAIFVSTEDTYSYQSSKNLKKASGEKANLRISFGKDHGTDIINNDATAMEYLLNWLLVEKSK